MSFDPDEEKSIRKFELLQAASSIYAAATIARNTPEMVPVDKCIRLAIAMLAEIERLEEETP